MRILSSQIEGFGPHKSLSIQWRNYPALTPIIADNGVGKTFIIESPVAAIFGDFPSYRGNIYAALTENGNGRGRVECTIEIKETTYKIVRMVTVSASGITKDNSAVVLIGPDFIETPPYRGPKKRDFDDWVKEHIGTRELAESTWFSCYRSDKDLCELLPSQRSDLIGDFINVSSLGDIAKAAKSQKNNTAARASLIGTQIRDQDPESNVSERIATEREKEDFINRDIAILTGDILRLKEEEGEVMDTLSLLTERLSQQSAFTEAQNQLEKLISNGETFRAEVERLRNLSGQIPELEAIRKRADQALDRSREMQAFFDARVEVHKARTVLESAEAELERVPPPIGSEEIERQIEELRASSSNSFEALSILEAQKAELMSVVPPGLAEILENIDVQKSKMRLESQKIADLNNQIKLERENQTQREALTLKVNSFRERLEAVRPGDKEYTREQLEAEREEYLALSKEAAGLEDSRRAVEFLPKMESELAFIKLDILAKQAILEEHELAEDLIGVHQEYVSRAKRISEQKTEVQTMLMTRQSEVNNASMEKKRLKDIAEKVATMNKNLKEERVKEERFEIIEKAFSRSGVQSILIESAIKPLEIMASTMLQQATAGENDIRIETIKENQDGTTREEMSIMISSHTGERDVYQYSGGQRRIFSTIIRLALARWISLRSGYSYGTIFIDEAFDSLSPKNTARLITLLDNVSHHFDNIIVVTPDRQKVLQLPEKIEL